MLVAGILVLVAFLIVAIVLSRNTSRQKKAAIESLKQEKAAIGHYDIMAMANEEIEKLGLRSIDGGRNLSADVLLKTWKDSPSFHDCDHSKLRYVVADGVDHRNAAAKDVHLECEGVRAEQHDDEPETPDNGLSDE